MIFPHVHRLSETEEGLCCHHPVSSEMSGRLSWLCRRSVSYLCWLIKKRFCSRKNWWTCWTFIWNLLIQTFLLKENTLKEHEWVGKKQMLFSLFFLKSWFVRIFFDPAIFFFGGKHIHQFEENIFLLGWLNFPHIERAPSLKQYAVHLVKAEMLPMFYICFLWYYLNIYLL